MVQRHSVLSPMWMLLRDKSKTLGHKCRMKPSGTKAASGLRRIKEGLHPISGTPQAQTHDLPPSFVEEQANDWDVACPPLSIQEEMENQ